MVFYKTFIVKIKALEERTFIMKEDLKWQDQDIDKMDFTEFRHRACANLYEIQFLQSDIRTEV